RFRPVDVQVSQWKCVIEDDGAVRLGFCMVQGLREEVGRQMEKAGTARRAVRHNHVTEGGPGRPDAHPDACPKCGGDDPSMIEVEAAAGTWEAYCNVCAHDWRGGVPLTAAARPPGGDGQAPDPARPRLRSVDDLVARTGRRRDALNRLASIDG